MTSFVRADCPTQSKSPLLYLTSHHLLQLDNFSRAADSSQLFTGQQQTIIIIRWTGGGGEEDFFSLQQSRSVTNNNINNKYIELFRSKLEYSYTFWLLCFFLDIGIPTWQTLFQFQVRLRLPATQNNKKKSMRLWHFVLWKIFLISSAAFSVFSVFCIKIFP